MRCHHNLRNYIIASALIAVIVVMFSAFILPGNVLADEAAISERRKNIVQLYVRNAFSNGNVKLRKFDLFGTIPITGECVGLNQSQCIFTKQTLDRSFEPSANAQLKASASPVITFVFAGGKQMASQLPPAIAEYAGGVSDISDPQCAMFYQCADSRILRGKIIASIDQPANKLRACLIVQISRLLGPGFSLTDKFSIRWSASLSKESEEKLDQTRHISAILQYIHMCPKLKPGMSESEVLKVLLVPTNCALNLEGIN